MPQLTLKDLPDVSKINDAKTYTLRGTHLRAFIDLMGQLWRGLNIGDSASVKVNQNGDSGVNFSVNPQVIQPGGGVSALGSYPWHLYDTTTGSTGQVQVNGGDGQAAQLNGFVCNVNGNPSDTQTGMPLAYPQLSVTGNGYIYAYAVPTTAGTASPLTSLDLYYEGTMQSQDTSNPAGYYWMLVATISNYAVDGSGNVSFTVNNAYGSGYGPSTLIYCGSVINVY